MQNLILNGPTHGRRRKFKYKYIHIYIYVSLTYVYVSFRMCVGLWICVRPFYIYVGLRTSTILMPNSNLNGPTHGRRRKFIYIYIYMSLLRMYTSLFGYA